MQAAPKKIRDSKFLQVKHKGFVILRHFAAKVSSGTQEAKIEYLGS